MKVTVKNKTTSPVNIPLMALVPGAADIISVAAPEACAECVFRVPPGNEEVQNAILSWAETNAITVEISFTPATMPNQTPSPTQAPTPPEAFLDPMNPLRL